MNNRTIHVEGLTLHVTQADDVLIGGITVEMRDMHGRPLYQHTMPNNVVNETDIKDYIAQYMRDNKELHLTLLEREMANAKFNYETRRDRLFERIGRVQRYI